MPVDWGMAAVVAALSIFAAPVIGNNITAIARRVYRRGRRVEQFKWDDIPDGPIHICRESSWGSCCRVISRHSSLYSMIPLVFDRAWNHRRTYPRFVQRVPAALPTTTSYVCTEARIILIMLLLAEKGHVTGWFEKVHDIVICRTSCYGQAFRLTHSKVELQCMLEGYPPWYRETFVTRTSIRLPFPIRDARDVSRGGWIVAVGLMDREPQKPLEKYRCPDEPAEPGWRENGRTFRMAVRRCRDHIVRHISPHFTNNFLVHDAISALNYLIEERTGSGMPYGHLPKTPPALQGSHCRFLMQNFNDYNALTDATDVARYSGMMEAAMATVVCGAHEVVQYLKDRGTELKIPSELLNFEQEVYLLAN